MHHSTSACRSVCGWLLSAEVRGFLKSPVFWWRNSKFSLDQQQFFVDWASVLVIHYLNSWNCRRVMSMTNPYHIHPRSKRTAFRPYKALFKPLGPLPKGTSRARKANTYQGHPDYIPKIYPPDISVPEIPANIPEENFVLSEPREVWEDQYEKLLNRYRKHRPMRLLR